jgi:four helix bundle protein
MFSPKENLMADEMIVLTRVFDLLAWLLPKSEKFPRPYRFTVTQRMMDCALDVQDRLCEAQYQQGQKRQQVLQDADAALKRLRVYLRLAHRWRWLNDGQYRHVSEMIAEIGRMVGGWIKQNRSR